MEGKRQHISLRILAVSMNQTGTPPPTPPHPSHYLMTLKRCTTAQVRREGGKKRGEEEGRKEIEVQLFTLGLSSLPCHRSSEIRRTLTPKHRASFQFHLAEDCWRNRAILQGPKRCKKNYSCTEEFNCTVRAPVPTKKQSQFSNKIWTFIRPKLF